MSEPTEQNSGQIVVYQAEDGTVKLDVRLEHETLWMTQKSLAQLFGVQVPAINKHLKNIFETGELLEDSVISILETTAGDGKSYSTRFYNLDAIIAVGYRVNSFQATRFRMWATQRLKEYLVKGFILDDERLKGGGGVADYFDELLARIRDIRASEARVYQRIRDIFSLAEDYRPNDENTRLFFAVMQNKIHYAATGLTAPEIIRQRADANKANMGLTSWKSGRVRKADTDTAKNYLDAAEIDTLNRITVMFLDQAEFRAQRRQNIRMTDWELFLDKFLSDTELPVLFGSGAVSHKSAISWAHGQYDTFSERRREQEETQAETRYVEDLRNSAKLLESERTKPKKKGFSSKRP